MASLAELLEPTRALCVGITFVLLYLLGGAVYRLYFSPLASFPGPKLAALTLFYEFYFDVVKRGQFTFHIRELHQKYGPIIRINPYELHIDDPDFYDVLYSGPSKKRDKYAWSTKMFPNSSSVFSTVTHELHRMRRTALNPYFSKQSITKLAPATIIPAIEKMCHRLEGFRESKEPVNLEAAFVSLTTDIITDYSFGKSYGFLDRPGFAPEWLRLQLQMSEFTLLNKQLPYLFPIKKRLSLWLMKFKSSCSVENIVAHIMPVVNGRRENNKTATRHSIFHELLDSDLPASEKTVPRLIDEALTIVAAGSNTTAQFLKTTSFHVLANPPILTKLRAELQGIASNPAELPSLRDLEHMPYLNAVVKEGFRISYGITSRLTRIAPNEDLVFNNYIIPAGTPVGMTSILTHENPRLFPEPKVFKPERWLEPGAQRLEKYLVNFSKGTRACLGMNLARAEIFLTLAALFGGRFELELLETDRSDVDVKHDFFNPSARLDSKGARVLVH
ncbi:uncharacterized protein K452DRAFT_328197 [Aplosporella prunicola CBS 121167]|uniref:Cytochrome P450 n=1 Tax=Aplosporella prunicola CBS 121167 TaxID=1176127 RepID=A0A6A6B7P9_9PEZI|nr:uncharacterized protein K452DRAFT_328197 [Aplosporella prunicola CBS 121167]KAF2139285.1 hypothetical protein K452DRAFT_328197 [Aplosporella prunicola CBS 121167]